MRLSEQNARKGYLMFRERDSFKINVSTFSKPDVESVDSILRSAYKAEHGYQARLLQYLSLQPGGSFVGRIDDHIVAFGASIVYGPFAYIGLMATDPEVQGRGVGRKVLDELLAYIDAQGCPTTLLDATPAGRPLYESSGFVDSDSTLVFQHEERNHGRFCEGASTPSDIDFSQLVAFDAPFFGADRGRLLRFYLSEIPERIFISRDSGGRIEGYLVAQRKTLGPWVASDSRIAEELLTRALGLEFEGVPQVFVAGSNRGAFKLLREFGFNMQRSLRHMYRGKAPRRARGTAIYGQATLGYG